MEAFEAQQQVCFQIECGCKFSNMSFDGYYFYFIEPGQFKIYQYDLYFRFVNTYITGKDYSYICYDRKENCFWACSRSFQKEIYQLNHNFQEVGFLTIKSKEGVGNRIIGLSCDYKSGGILVAYQNCVIEIEKKCAERTRRISMNPSTFFFSLSPCRSGFASSKIECSRQYFCFYSCDGTNQFQCLVDSDYFIEDGLVAISPYGNGADNVMYLLLTKKDGMQCVIKLRINYFGQGSLLHFCELNFDHTSGYEEALCSFALVEASIARILNCEGEKMERAMECGFKPQILIALNQSVNHTILNLTHLEQILKIGQMKLLHSMEND